MKRADLKPIARAINAGKLKQARAMVDDILARDDIGPSWRLNFEKLARVFDGAAPFTIIGRGNSKLGDKFMTWSTLPATEPGAIGCPGAGECVEFCYSVKAWRYPAAFCRQAQNTILLQSAAGRAAILAALDSTHARGFSTLRLYVDGDFSARRYARGLTDYKFFMRALAERPTIQAYGYSKSLNQICDDIAPPNYRLNISSGHRHSAAVQAAAENTATARGKFIAYSKIRARSSADHGRPEHRTALVKAYRAETGRKAFACPGSCHNCSPHGHACGSSKFNDVDIIIAAH